MNSFTGTADNQTWESHIALMFFLLFIEKVNFVSSSISLT